MSLLEQKISNFIESQFPEFYLEEERNNFVAFVKAYYEWLESSGNVIHHSRRIIDYKDIDETIEEFIEYFQEQYLFEFPKNIVADKKLVLKHIQDLYRSKGSPRSYELLFRILYNESIELNVPHEKIIKLSDNEWKVPTYIEVSYSKELNDLVGKKIRLVGRPETSAIVESYEKIIVNNKEIHILYISNIRGIFEKGYKIEPIEYEIKDFPVITGSMTAISIQDGGNDYAPGDVLNVEGSGILGKAVVKTVSKETTFGTNFFVINGGSGYTLNSTIQVFPTLELHLTNISGTFLENEKIVATNSANGYIRFISNNIIRITEFVNSNNFILDDTITGQNSSATAKIIKKLGGSGTGAFFNIGSLKDKEIIQINTTEIANYLNTTLEFTTNTFSLGVSNVSGTFSVGDIVTSSVNTTAFFCYTITPIDISEGEGVSNTSHGISNVLVMKTDKTLLYLKTNSNTVNIPIGAILVGNTSGAQIEVISEPIVFNTTGNGTILSVNSTHIVVNSNNYYYGLKETLSNANTYGTATIESVTRRTNWQFANSSVPNDNLDSKINESSPWFSLEVGTIETLTNINPGKNYFTPPYVHVEEPLISQLVILDSNSTQKGNNAIIGTSVSSVSNSITHATVYDSGFGYVDGETVTLKKPNSSNVPAKGNVINYNYGKSQGYWSSNKGFSSDIGKLFDGDYYQFFSYEIISNRLLKSYEKFVKDIVHPVGYKLFGSVKLKANREVNYDLDFNFKNIFYTIIAPYHDLLLERTANTFSIEVANTENFLVGQNVIAQVNTIAFFVDPVSNNYILPEEGISNTSAGVLNAYVSKADKKLIYITGNNSFLANVINIPVGTNVVGNISGAIAKTISEPINFNTNATGTIVSVNTTHIVVSVSNGYYMKHSKLVNLSNTSVNTDIIQVNRLTDWNFGGSTVPLDNLDSILEDSIPN